MARETQRDRVKRWTNRLRQAGRLYDRWSERYHTADLEDYYLGRQWAGQGITEEEAKQRYTINLVYSSTETNRPALVFYRPQIRVEPRPGRSDEFGSDAANRARLVRDTVQTFIDDPDLDFVSETALALQEAHFRFGVIEVGYTADWIDNPNAGRPILRRGPDGEALRDPDTGQDVPIRDSTGNPVEEPDRVVTAEKLYIKRIPANHFRVSVSSKNALHRNDWVAYYEWFYLEDVKKNRDFKNTAGLNATGIISDRYREEVGEEERSRHEGMVRVWKIWDLRTKERLVLAEGHDLPLQEGRKFTYLPFAIIKLHEILDSFYPMPPVFQWIGPQDEINETREMQRAHRRRFYRRYTVDPGVDDEELRKLEDGGDGVYAKIPAAQAPRPVPDAPLAADQWRHLDEAKSDFIQVSGVTSEQRGIAESGTATQATILDARGRLRESAARTKVGDWLAAIGRLILLTIRDHMALEFWIQRNVDPFAQDPTAVMSVAERWSRIRAGDLGTTDLDFSVDLASMSPITEEILRTSWNQVLALLANPSIAIILSHSEALLRKTMFLYGIRSESEIREIQKVVREVASMAMAQQVMEAGGGRSNGAGSSSPPAPGSPAPGVESLLAQMASINRQTSEAV